MSRFDNKLCPVCRRPLTDKSDVVVCPVCGTPHHRACYMKNNRCGVESWHASGFVWQGHLPDEPANEPPPQQGSDDPHHAEYPQGAEAPDMSGGFGQPVDIEEFLEQLQKQTMDDRRGEDGVSSRELSAFVGRSVMHYSQAFAAFRAPAAPGGKKRKVFFNLCAGLFAPVHQFYRRMDLIGVILLLLELFYYIPTLLSVIGAANAALLRNISLITSLVSFVVMVLMCMFGDYLYYRFTVKRIKKIRMAYDDGKAEGYYEALAEKGNPSWLRAIISILAVYFAEACLILYFTRLSSGTPL